MFELGYAKFKHLSHQRYVKDKNDYFSWSSVQKCFFKISIWAVIHTASKAFEDFHPQLVDQREKELVKQKLVFK